jgi:GntR family transcriptional regulator, transcriptional repressor for pyruvate dehydrogenase complex
MVVIEKLNQSGELLTSVEALLGGSRATANAFEGVVERLASAIKMGLYQPGQQLPIERDLAQIMGVSRSTLREAIRVLTVQGILVVKRGRGGGTFITENIVLPGLTELKRRLIADRTSIREILDHRLIIEVGLAGLAAERVTGEQKQELQTIVDRMHEAESDFGTYRPLDMELHLLIARATQSNRLISITADIHAELSDLMRLIPHSQIACIHSTEQHQQIVNSICKGRVTLVKKLMQEHVMGTNSLLSGLLD